MSKEQKDTEDNLIITTGRLSGYRAGRKNFDQLTQLVKGKTVKSDEMILVKR